MGKVGRANCSPDFVFVISSKKVVIKTNNSLIINTDSLKKFVMTDLVVFFIVFL